MAEERVLAMVSWDKKQSKHNKFFIFKWIVTNHGPICFRIGMIKLTTSRIQVPFYFTQDKFCKRQIISV